MRAMAALLPRAPKAEEARPRHNVVTGKGDILASRKHSLQVGTHVVEQFLGLGEDHVGEEVMLDAIPGAVDDSVERIAAWIRGRPPLDADKVEAILRRVRARQEGVGYMGSYLDWIKRVTPRGMA